MKKPGRAREWDLELETGRSADVIERQDAGKSMEFMTKARAMPYVELHACSAFSFLRGGSSPSK